MCMWNVSILYPGENDDDVWPAAAVLSIATIHNSQQHDEDKYIDTKIYLVPSSSLRYLTEITLVIPKLILDN